MKIHTIPALSDNYAYLVSAEGSKDAIAIDPSEAAPIEAALRHHGLNLALIINTHHHHDHIGGNLALKSRFNCDVWCSLNDLPRVPGASRGLNDGETVSAFGVTFQVLSIPGHTQGQIALHFEADDALFVGDTVFSMGCGRLLEGTPEQMFASLKKIKALPPETRIYFGHEYTKKNAEFTLEQFPELSALVNKRVNASDSAVRTQGYFPAPTLADELQVNTFLRAQDVESFARLRRARDVF